MRKVLILGAGMVVKPIVTYLLETGIEVTVASRTQSKAENLIGSNAGGRAVSWTVDREDELDKMVAGHDLTVSLLPWQYHPLVARYCLKHKKNMVTTSYVKPEMQALDKQAKDAGIIILNELGLDPGIDHMSAMRVIDSVHSKGGLIEGFYSICGALPAPESADNPFRYKFSWSPKGVIMAGNNEGRFLRDGEIISVPTENLFKNPLKTDFPGAGKLEIYPNRDSIPYIDLYSIPETKTMFRGTFRYPGWCEIIDVMKQLGLLSPEKKDFDRKSLADFMASMISGSDAANLRNRLAAHAGISAGSLPVLAMEWLGLFENSPLTGNDDSPFEIVASLMIEKMMLKENERDMVALQHIFLASYPGGKKEVIRSSLLDFGTPAADTAVARTVALPAAIGVEMILNNRIDVRGVHIPVIPAIYNPVLDRLENMNIKVAEEFDLPESTFIKLHGQVEI
jgi:saccharopine dehydrogenase-like NADP-dependent oxidoreductase